ncbi:MAG: type II toxin-antitoxin system PemK/MazF family toxin [Acidobacteriota bacterium]
MNAGDQPPRRGEIWWTHLPTDPPGKNRPALIVSLDARNAHPRADTVLAIPLSTSIHTQSPFHLMLSPGESGLREASAAWAENITVIRKEWLVSRVEGHRRQSHTQICRLAELVRQAMGCLE